MKQDRLQRAKDRFSDSMEAVREQYDRIREDLRFSNPAKPEQWSAQAVELRKGRPMLTFNHCPKYIRQVANDGRASVPSIQVTPADAFAHAKAAEAINGRLRHIEYVSKAKVAYTTALSSAANVGLGWLRVIPEVINAETNQQEPRILRVHDVLSCVLDPDAAEPDGCDAEFGFVLSPMTRKKFARAYPKAQASHGWSDEYRLWARGDEIIVAEYFEIERTRKNKILIRTPDGEMTALTEDEYWQVANITGVKPEYVDSFTSEQKSVKWSKMTGAETLEETDFPSTYIPIVPVIGDEQWVDGQRFLCGLTRQLMDGQRMHNAEMSSYTESILSQPKAPYMVSERAIEGHEEKWKALNRGNPAFLVYKDLDEDDKPVNAPSRIAPPQLPSAFANGANMAVGEMDSSVGMFRAAYGEQGRAISGRAKAEDRKQSDTGTYHYHDNLARAVEHLGRIVFEMDRALTDTARTVRTMSVDDKPSYVRFDPDMESPVKLRGNDVEAVNPRIGEYDMRVKTGPAFVTQAEEAAEELAEMFRGAPELLPVLGPTWVRLRNIPYAEKVAKLLLAMAPPQVQAIEAEDEKNQQPISPQAKAAIGALEKQVQELSAALEGAAAEADKTAVEKDKARVEREKAEADMLIRGYQAVTERLKVVPPMTAEQMVALVQQTVAQALVVPPVDPQETAGVRDDLPEAPPFNDQSIPAAVGEAPPIAFEPETSTGAIT